MFAQGAHKIGNEEVVANPKMEKQSFGRLQTLLAQPQPSRWELGKICLKFTPLEEPLESLAPEAGVRLDVGQDGLFSSWGRVSLDSF